MQLRIKLFKARMRRERLAELCGRPSLNLTCTKCKAPRQPALYEGDVCKPCWKPKPVGHVSCSRELVDTSKTPETLELQEVFRELLAKHELNHMTFAKLIEVGASSIYLWRNGDLGPVGQERLNAKIRAGIEQHFSPMEAVA